MRNHDNIYIAGRFDRKEELRGYADTLTSLGYYITSTWLYGKHESDGECTTDELAAFAEEDLLDIMNADVLLAFTEDKLSSGYHSGGRHVELGFALGQGIDVAIIGPPENVFHHHKDVRTFDSFDALMESRAAKASADGEKE